jgi:hypothetical protein
MISSAFIHYPANGKFFLKRLKEPKPADRKTREFPQMEAESLPHKYQLAIRKK